MEIGVHRQWSFQVDQWNGAKKRRTKASQYFVTLDFIPSNAHQECVANTLSICLFSGLLVLFYAWSAKFVQAQICVGYMHVSRLYTSEGLATSSQLKHWSGNWRVCQNCSASPVREKWMRKRNSTVKLFKVQSSNLKSLQKKWGGPGCPNSPISDGLDKKCLSIVACQLALLLATEHQYIFVVVRKKSQFYEHGNDLNLQVPILW